MTLEQAVQKIKENSHLLGTNHRGMEITHILPAPNDQTFDEYLRIYLMYDKDLLLAIRETRAKNFDVCILCVDKKSGVTLHDWL